MSVLGVGADRLEAEEGQDAGQAEDLGQGAIQGQELHTRGKYLALMADQLSSKGFTVILREGCN